MQAGIDIGYNAGKFVTDSRRASFASVVGTPTRQRFSVNGHQNEILLTVAGQSWLVGDSAVENSRFLKRREDRHWVDSEEYLVVALAGLSELTTANGVEVKLVTGLPVNYFADKSTVEQRLRGEHRVQRAGRNAQRFSITDIRVVPQPFGTLLNEALDQRGNLGQPELAGRVGVIDIGGKTTNILSANKLAELPGETVSINLGGWDIIRQLREQLAEVVPDLELRDHELAAVLRERRVRVAGEWIDLPKIDDILTPMADQVSGTIQQLWGSALRLDVILISGGGAHLIGDRLRQQFKQARVVKSPVYANALGFWKLSQRLR
ncbi:MAG: ParM/StbA family protein [Chloroflexi bacterium]|nr:MAG: ParM/StbA family protein [Chloroflexota bacterium]